MLKSFSDRLAALEALDAAQDNEPDDDPGWVVRLFQSQALVIDAAGAVVAGYNGWEDLAEELNEARSDGGFYLLLTAEDLNEAQSDVRAGRFFCTDRRDRWLTADPLVYDPGRRIISRYNRALLLQEAIEAWERQCGERIERTLMAVQEWVDCYVER